VAAIEARGLARTFSGGIVAVAGIDFDVADGEIYAFLGPNGAGKTTTMRMLTTLLRPTGGSARVAGHDVVSEAHQVRRAIGVALQEAALDPLMTGDELMLLQATLHGIPGPEAKRRGRDLLERVGLADRAGAVATQLSEGDLKRLELARALATGPTLLLLDEPFAGLSQPEIELLSATITQLRGEGVTLVVVEHKIGPLIALVDRVVAMDEGKVIADGEPRAVMADPAVVTAYLGGGQVG